jgi:hypothetical protein
MRAGDGGGQWGGCDEKGKTRVGNPVAKVLRWRTMAVRATAAGNSGGDRRRKNRRLILRFQSGSGGLR